MMPPLSQISADPFGPGSTLTDAAPAMQADPSAIASSIAESAGTQLDILSGYILVFAVAFIVTVLMTPLVRKLAIANGIVDHPSEARKIHKMPIAYLGGVAVYLGIVAGIIFSYFGADIPLLVQYHEIRPEHLIDGYSKPIVPLWIALGMTSIVLVGLLDNVTGIPPRVKLGGQLIAAAALALGNIGINVAAGILSPIGNLSITRTSSITSRSRATSPAWDRASSSI